MTESESNLKRYNTLSDAGMPMVHANITFTAEAARGHLNFSWIFS